MPRLVALTGAAGVGKDTAGMILSEEHGYHIYAFADPIYDALVAMLQYSEERLRDRALKEVPIPELGVSPRRLLQTLGTEWGRQVIHPDWWVKLAKHRIQITMQKGYDVVLTDVRFENEVELVRQLGGRLIRIEREGVQKVREHVSENPRIWSMADAGVTNNGTVKELEGDLLATLDMLF